MKKKVEMRTYDVCLGYYKEGDDLAHCQESAKSDAAALAQHSAMLSGAAEVLAEMSALAKKGKLEIDCADTHVIMVSADPAAVKKFVKMGVFTEPEDEDEEYEDGIDPSELN
jgi:hypothetical protein